MRARFLRRTLTLLLMAAWILPAPFVHATSDIQPPFPEGESRYFSQTGHSVEGPFLEFFETRGGVRIFGYPQTEAFYDALIGLHVQYFDSARLEWHPENPKPYQVQLGLLGEILGHREPAVPRDRLAPESRFRRYFPETGHMVSFAFLDFYEENGGLDIFGYPISELRTEGEYTVQYFQRMRLEWHPERMRGNRVVLGALGNEYLSRFGAPSEYLMRQNPPVPAIPQEAVSKSPTADPVSSAPSVRAWATVRQPVVGEEGMQTVSVYVTDPHHRPLGGARVTMEVRYPAGAAPYTTAMPDTDLGGISEISFRVDSPPSVRRVVVEVRVEYQDVTSSVETFFSRWW
jgi:hypothetical protein